MSEAEWLRLPEEGKRCTVTGLSRSSLSELLKERDPETHELLIRSIVKKKPGAKRGIRLIERHSLLNYLKLEAERQAGLKWAPGILNPHNYSIDQVVENQELFGYFLDPDCQITDYDWENGIFATRKQRVQALLSNHSLQIQESSQSTDDD